MADNQKRQRRGMFVDDDQKLQTDVMTFFVIICLCLMIVFALVQSLPFTSNPKKTTMEDKKPTKNSAKPIEKNYQKSETKDGFTLGFESNQALLKLLAINSNLKFYIMYDKKSWLLIYNMTDKIHFIPASSPGLMYEMNPTTVPNKIVEAAKKVTNNASFDAVTYSVALPENIISQIQKLMKEKNSGELTISSEGRVVLDERRSNK
jgi:hypothetical protein